MKRFTIIKGLIAKDISQIFSNKFVATMTILSIVAYAVLFYVMPKTINETFEIALHAPKYGDLIEQSTESEEGIEIESFESVDELKKKVSDGDFNAGITVPEDFQDKLAKDEKPEIRVYYPSDAPEEVKKAVGLILKESAFNITRQELPVEIDVEILGKDRLGEQIPPRERLRPTFIIFLLFMELWALANLITEETSSKTLEAILMTPATISDVIIAKGIVGTFLAFSEAVILAALLQVLGTNTAFVLITLLLGALMVTGIAFVIATFSKDIISVTGYAMLAMIFLIIPAIAVIIPGSASGWVKLFPSYYLVEVFDQVVTYGESFTAFWKNILILIAFNLAVFPLGILLLRRKFQ